MLLISADRPLWAYAPDRIALASGVHGLRITGPAPLVAVAAGVAGVIALTALVFAAVETSQNWDTGDPSSVAAPAPASTTTSPTYMSGGWA